MTLGDFLSGIKVDKSVCMKMKNFPISFDLQDTLQEKYYFQTRSGPQKAGITIGEIHGHNKSLLPHVKPVIKPVTYKHSHQKRGRKSRFEKESIR